MAMAALEATLSFSTVYPSFPSSSSPKLPLISTASALAFIKLRNSTIITASLNLKTSTRNHVFVICSTAQDVAEPAVVEAESDDQTLDLNQKRKLYLFNLPWSLSVVDIKNLFSECGEVKDVEIIKQKDGRSRGFAFVTMASGDAAQAVVDKFHDTELSGRTITVQFAKRFKKPSPPRSATAPPAGEMRHKLYVSNLAWKVRSSHLRELFSNSATYKPVSTRVVFDTPAGRSSGYGFVSFDTKEEADAALSALDGTELLGRPIRLTLSEKNIDASENPKEEVSGEKENEEIPEKQPEE